MSIKFTQSCPTCGRRMDIRAALLGCTVACQHCGAEFTATANEDIAVPRDHDEDLLTRVEKALRRAEAASLVGAHAAAETVG